jgi:hypothetical protein
MWQKLINQERFSLQQWTYASNTIHLDVGAQQR